MRILGLSGSLRKASLNTAILGAAQRLAPPHFDFSIYGRLGCLPLFNPDLNEEFVPLEVEDFRQEVLIADGIMICSPEYARGISGTLKNALDWLVGGLEFAGKGVMVLNASPRARDADASLRLVLTTMSARLIAAPSGPTPLFRQQWRTNDIVADIEASLFLCRLLEQMESGFKSDGLGS